MGKGKLYAGVIIGAVIGGLVTLRDKDTKRYVKTKCLLAKGKTKSYMDNPSQSVRLVRESIKDWNKTITAGAENTIATLEQIEKTLDKVVKKPHADQEQLKE